ncbi:MAG: hypothetical protein ACLQBQ_07650 [Smithella sp.]
MLKHNKILFIPLVLLLMLGYSTTIFSATYYIDYASGSDANNGTSITQPWKRCPGMKGFSGSYSHSAGDVFVFKGGVIWPVAALRLTIAKSGANGNPDIYIGGQRCDVSGLASCNGGTAWGSDYPIFDGGAVNGMLAIYSSGKSHITIDGIKIVNVGYTDGSGQAIAFSGGSGITVKNCWLQPNGVNAFAYGASSGTYSKVYFHDNIIKQAGRVHVSVGDATCDDFQFYNNTMYGSYDYDRKSYHTDGFMIGADGVGTWKATNLKIYNNKFVGDWTHGATAFIYINGTPKTYYGWKYVYIYNNQLTSENATGCTLSPAAIFFAGGHSDVKVYNNTIDARSSSGTPTSHCIAFAWRINNIEVKNNILTGCDNGITIGSDTTGTVDLDYNLYYTLSNNHLIWDSRSAVNKRCNTLSGCQGSPVYQEAHGKVGEPRFMALPHGGVAGSGDWHLQAGSPARTGGVNLGIPYTSDIEGVVGGNRIGAYARK